MNLANIVCFGLATVGCVAQTHAPKTTTPFDYDAKKPLELKMTELKQDERSITFSFSFQGQSERVPGILVVPKGVSKPPVVLALHGLGGNKSFGQQLAPTLTQAGYAVLALDAPGHGERADSKKPLLPTDLELLHNNWVEGIVDYRRALDALAGRPEVDSKRVLLMGISMGGMMGSLLAGSDSRICAAALIVAGGDWRTVVSKTSLPIVKPLKDLLDKVDPKSAAASKLNEIDPVNWVAKIAPRPVLLLQGDADTIMPKEASNKLIEAAKEPKSVIRYKGGHIPPMSEWPKIYDWLLKNTPPKS